MDVRLIVQKGNRRVRAIRLKHVVTVIGRRRDCTLRIPSSEISRQHCRLTIASTSVTVEDLDSVNGTYVNGRRIGSKATLRSGDRLELGPVRFLVEYEKTSQSREPEADGEVLEVVEEEAAEVLPVRVEDEATSAFVIGDLDDVAAALPVDDDADALTAEVDSGRVDALPVADDELVPLDDEPAEADDLRNLISQMEDRKPPRE
jgi:pSer/pThr/pTyr-binding forkhead associated (FHA) protein